MASVCRPRKRGRAWISGRHEETTKIGTIEVEKGAPAAGQRLLVHEQARRDLASRSALSKAERRLRWIKRKHEEFKLKKKYPEVDFNLPERARREHTFRLKQMRARGVTY